MKFVSLRTKRFPLQDKVEELPRATPEDFTKARAASHNTHTYVELRQQIHNDLRMQHPEWIQPNGESPMCDYYEARLTELLGADVAGLN